jgi:hypothetical protein
MKAMLTAAALSIMGTFTMTHGQGQLNFATKVNTAVNAKFVDCDTRVPVSAGYMAGLEIDDGFGNFSLVPGTVTSFRTGAAAGYVLPISATIPDHDCASTVSLRVVAFNGSSEADFPKATRVGVTYPVSVTLSCGLWVPANLDGLVGVFCVPEPSTISLVLFVATVIVLGRRK